MTRTTLKALWFGGGGIIATWLAVSPNHLTPASSESAPTARPAAATELSAEHLSAQTNRLLDRTGAAALSDSTRNLFQYNSHRAPRREQHHVAQPETIAPAMPLMPPPFALSGVAQKAGKRTAIITLAGQIYMVAEGDSFAGGYTVIKVDPEAALIRDASGVEHRLVLR
jgi:hypothetical protein